MKIKLLALFLIFAYSELSAQTIKISDANFEQALIDLNLDDTKDGEVLRSNVENIKTLNVNNKGISNLSGIEAFTGLEELNCSDNSLSNIDLSLNSKLKKLNIRANEFASINLSVNYDLLELNCASNKISDLSLINNTSLERLDCGSNKLTSLELRRNSKLKSLNCYSNELTSLNLGQNILLESINCNNNKLTSLGLDKLSLLSDLDINTNKLKTLNLNSNIKLNRLVASVNELTSIDLSVNIDLRRLEIGGNKLSQLDVSKNTKLETLWCEANELSSLDVSTNNLLTDLACLNNDNMTTLLLPSSITEVSCYNNSISTLKLDHIPNLKKLVAFNNKLRKLDLSKNTLLEELSVSDNELGCVQLGSDTEANKRNSDPKTWKTDTNVQYTTDCASVTYQVSVEANANGQVSFNKSPIGIGETLIVNIQANDAYNIKKVFINKINKGKLSTYTLENVISDVHVKVEYELKTYTLTSDYTQAGTITFSKVNAKHGESTKFNIVANEGYKIKEVFQNNTRLGSSNQYTISSIKENINVRVVFELKEYLISLDKASNGRIEVKNLNPKHFEDVQVNIIPEQNYVVKHIFINNELQSLGNSFTLFRIDSHKKIRVEFELNSYALSVLSSPNGAVTFDKKAVSHGESVTLKIAPNAGFEVNELIVNNNSLGKKTTFKIDNVTNDVQIQVLYKQTSQPTNPATSLTFKVNILPTAFGKLTTDKTSVNEGEDLTFSFAIDQGYKIKEFKINDQVMAVTGDSFVLRGVNSDTKAEVVFEKNSSVLTIKQERISFSPNPVESTLNIQNVPNGRKIQLLDSQGKFLKEFQSLGKEMNLDLTKLSNGLYYLSIEGLKVEKIIKK